MRTVFRGISPAWNAEHFRWQQEENPWFDGFQGRLALHQGAVVGMRLLHAAEWEAGHPAVRFRAPCFAGTVIEEPHRSRGLLSRLTRILEEDVERSGAPFAFNLNAGPVTHIAALTKGWRSLGPFGPVMRPAWAGGPGPVPRAARVLRRSLSALLRSPGVGLTISSQTRPAEMAELAARGRSDGRIRHVKDLRWFRWRYRDPSSRYRFAYLHRSGRLIGYLVFGANAPPLPPGQMHLVNWERGDELPWSELLGAVARLADRWVASIVAWTAALPSEAQGLLSELGFAPYAFAGPLASERPTFLVGRIGSARSEASKGHAGDDAGSAIAGARIDAAASWDLRPIFADSF